MYCISLQSLLSIIEVRYDCLRLTANVFCSQEEQIFAKSLQAVNITTNTDLNMFAKGFIICIMLHVYAKIKAMQYQHFLRLFLSALLFAMSQNTD